jgi:hypothetical protein
MTGLIPIADVMPRVMAQIAPNDPDVKALAELTCNTLAFDILRDAIDRLEDSFDAHPRDRMEPEAADLDRQALSGLRIELEALRCRLPLAAKRMAARLAKEAAENDDDTDPTPPAISAKVAA